MLAEVLPDPVNLGYESLRNAVIDSINNIRIKRIADVATALKSPINGFDVFVFEPGDSAHKAVLDAAALDDANQKIMSLYHIPSDQVLDSALVHGSPDATAGPEPMVRK